MRMNKSECNVHPSSYLIHMEHHILESTPFGQHAVHVKLSSHLANQSLSVFPSQVYICSLKSNIYAYMYSTYNSEFNACVSNIIGINAIEHIMTKLVCKCESGNSCSKDITTKCRKQCTLINPQFPNLLKNVLMNLIFVITDICIKYEDGISNSYTKPTRCVHWIHEVMC